MPRPRVSVQITLTSTLVAFAVILTVGWEILVAREFRALMTGFTPVHWLLVVVGAVLFAGIIAASILQTVWLVREIRAGQRQRSFVDAVTHELHTPLASLRLYLETLQSQTLDEDRRTEFLQIMAKDIDRLERTVGHILQAARSEDVRPPKNPVDVKRLLERCAEELRERHGLDEKSVRVHGTSDVATSGDAEELRLAFRNLLENAVRYATDRVRIDVDIKVPSRRWIEVVLADQGIGIPASEWERIFERFQRLSPAAVRSRRGLGLGLFLVRSIVKQHRGSVYVESEGEGKGSRFVVRLRRRKNGS